jgi:hypothetical protein
LQDEKDNIPGRSPRVLQLAVADPWFEAPLFSFQLVLLKLTLDFELILDSVDPDTAPEKKLGF